MIAILAFWPNEACQKRRDEEAILRSMLRTDSSPHRCRCINQVPKVIFFGPFWTCKATELALHRCSDQPILQWTWKGSAKQKYVRGSHVNNSDISKSTKNPQVAPPVCAWFVRHDPVCVASGVCILWLMLAATCNFCNAEHFGAAILIFQYSSTLLHLIKA